MCESETLIHLIAGGVGGTMGAMLTCPLEVIKTRLQSSCSLDVRLTKVRPTSVFLAPEFNWNFGHLQQHCAYNKAAATTVTPAQLNGAWNLNAQSRVGFTACLRQLVEREGTKALFKGLGPNLVGVAPTRAVYFCAYSTAKRKLNRCFTPESPLVHLCSAASAGFVACTLTNPIWFVKTRLQLNRCNNTTAWQCILNIYQDQGIRGFYRGISASYFGISETMINFVVYEALKVQLQRLRQNRLNQVDEETSLGGTKANNHLVDFMLAGAVSKSIACCLAYPHEVARTRLREENSRYTGFFQTLTVVYREEGLRGLYRGLGTQLIRQIPNMAIMMTTYEACVYFLTRYAIVPNPPTLDEFKRYDDGE